jgi:hypothetical protein
MRDVARLGFILVGVHVALSGLQGITPFIALQRNGEFWLAGLAVGIQVLCVILPGVALVVFNGTLSSYVFPEVGTQLAALDLVAAGLAVLGAYLVVVGAASAVSSLLLLPLSLEGPLSPWRDFLAATLAGVLRVVLGVVLFRYPTEVLRRLGTRAA